ncbi:hypothetical protein L3Q82_003817 [Scortum barcoo]|uniref:Uncharacterized protein n=1 Tax=Scortum barcoo TaxID=214431 RepID=A0ACB8X6J6_9TELE|nr:hypothetical protein L3Q82_003817 [Scortum barcoo]
MSDCSWKFGGESRPQLICSTQTIVAALGDDVILPCHVEPPVDLEKMSVDWWRPDIPPDPGDAGGRYVHRYHDNQDAEVMKMSSYSGRTALIRGDLKHSNISLRISSVKLSDGGRYRCVVHQLASDSDVELVVGPNETSLNLVVNRSCGHPNYVKTVTTETPLHPRNLQTPNPNNETNVEVTSHDQISQSVSISAVVLLVVLILAGVGVGYLLKHKSSKTDVIADPSDWLNCVDYLHLHVNRCEILKFSVQHHRALQARHTKLIDLRLNSALCDWILNFLTGRPQAVRMGSTTSSTLTLNTGEHHNRQIC